MLARFAVLAILLTVICQFHQACELACVRMKVNAMHGLTSLRDCAKDLCHHFISMLLSPLRCTPFWYVSVRTQTLWRDFVHLEEDLGEDRVEVQPLAFAYGDQSGVCYTPTMHASRRSRRNPCEDDSRPWDRFLSSKPHRTVPEKETDTILLRTPN